MRLGSRLRVIADMVSHANRVADIGTDHGYLPVFLIRSGMADRVIATDVNHGPLGKAAELIRYYRLEDRIETRLGYGLGVIKSGEVDTIVIAGMGGALIRDILQAGAEVLDGALKLVLQPMNAQEVVRQWLVGNGFAIVDETLAGERDKIYQVISAQKGEQEINDAFYLEVGEKLIQKRDPLLGALLRKKILELEDITRGLQGSSSEDAKKRLGECMEKIARFREVIRHCR